MTGFYYLVDITLKCSSMAIRIAFYSFLLFLAACQSSDQKMYPKREDMTESVYASGVVKAVDQYEAYANTNGIIDEIWVKEGDTVSIGTPLLSIYNESARIGRETAELLRTYSDRNTNRTRLQSLEASIQTARSKFQNDSLLYERQKRLYSEKVGSLTELEQRKLAFESSKNSLITAQLQYEDLRREIDFNEKNAGRNLALSKALEQDLVLKSKVNGRVYSVLKEKGEIVNTQTPLAVLGSASDFILELSVDEYDIAKIANGQEVLVYMDSYREAVFKAEITRVYPIMDQRSKTFVVEARFTAPPPVLYPNLSLEANVVIQTRKGVLTLPREYVYDDRFVISAKGDTIPVKLGLKDYIKAEIVSGVDENTRIIRPGS